MAVFATILWLLVLLPPAPTADSSPAAGGPIGGALRERAARLVADGAAEALVVGVHRQGEDRFVGFGRLGPERPAAPDETSIFEIGSITKTFTGLLLAKAVEEGLVAPDDPIDRFLPPGVRWPGDEPRVTLRHLATHTAGLPRLPRTMRPADPLDPYADFGREDLWREVESLVLESEPGARYAYSNLGYGLLGELLARVFDARRYEEALRREVLRPLGLDETFFEVPDDLAHRFAAPAKGGLVRARRWRFDALAGAGALRQSARDLLRFAVLQLRPEGSPLARALLRSHEPLHRFPGGGGVAYGWHVRPDGVLWHNGQTGGYHGMVAVDLEARLAVCALASALPRGGGRVDELVFSWLEELRSKEGD